MTHRIIYLVAVVTALISCKSNRVATTGIIESGVASWYGPNFHGRQTANGEKFDMHALTAAHRTLPFNTVVEVHNQDNGKTVRVRINDRGPFAKGRIIDLSKKAAEKIDMIGPGTANIRLVLISESDRQLPSDLKTQTFTIQVASFESKEAAYEKSKHVRDSWVQKVTVDGKSVFRVYSGNFLSRQAAERQLGILNKTGIHGFVKQIEN